MTGKQRSIFITGAASGIGLATARLFAEKGWFVGMADIDGSGLEEIAAEIGAINCSRAILDVSDRVAYQKVIRDFGEKSGGRLDLLFNNAGISGGRLFSETEHSEMEQILQINLVGVMTGIQLAYPLLRNTPNALCFNTSSSSAIIGVGGLSVYSATKHAVKGLTEALSIEFHTDGVRVADVLPGQIDTGMMRDEMRRSAPKEGMWRLMPASAVADVVWAAYQDTSGRLHWYVPEDLEKLEYMVAENPSKVRNGSVRYFSSGPLRELMK